MMLSDEILNRIRKTGTCMCGLICAKLNFSLYRELICKVGTVPIYDSRSCNGLP